MFMRIFAWHVQVRESDSGVAAGGRRADVAGREAGLLHQPLQRHDDPRRRENGRCTGGVDRTEDLLRRLLLCRWRLPLFPHHHQERNPPGQPPATLFPLQALRLLRPASKGTLFNKHILRLLNISNIIIVIYK